MAVLNPMNPLGLSEVDNSGDCLPDGTFSTAAPNGVVTGGPCIIDGNNLFENRADVLKVTGSFTNLKSAMRMFSGSGARSIDASFPSVTYAYQMFGWCRSLKSIVIDMPLVTNFFMDHCYALVDVSYRQPFEKLSSADGLFNFAYGLSAASVEATINALPTYSSGTHNLGLARVASVTDYHRELAAAKGWTLIV